MKYKIRINPMAISDIQELKAYITEDNPGAAVKLGNVIYAKIGELADFPEMGTPLSAKVKMKTDYRYLVCGSYLVFYKVEGEFISVYRVLNGVRDYLAILFEDELTEDTN